MAIGRPDDELEEVLESMKSSDKVKAWEQIRTTRDLHPQKKPMKAEILCEYFPQGYKEDDPERKGEIAAREVEDLLNRGANIESVDFEDEEYSITIHFPAYRNTTLVYEGPFEDDSEDGTLEQFDTEYSFEEMADIAKDLEIIEAKEKAPALVLPFLKLGQTEKPLPADIWDPEAPRKNREDRMNRSGEDAGSELEWIEENRNVRPVETSYEEAMGDYHLEFKIGDDRTVIYETPTTRDDELPTTDVISQTSRPVDSGVR